MLDLFKDLFGGSEQTSTSSSTSGATSQSTGQSSSGQSAGSTSVDLTPEQFAALRSQFSGVLSGVLNGLPQYGGPTTAPLGANEGNLLTQLMGQTGAGTERSNLLSDTISGKFLEGNPYLQKYIEAAQRPTLEGLTEVLGRTLPGRFTQAGQFTTPKGSSAFDMAAALATRGAAQELGDIATKIAYPAYESERGRQQEAVKLDQAEVDSTIKNLQAQALPRMIQENGIERGMSLFQDNIKAFLQALQIVGGVTAPTLGTVASSSGQSSASQQATSNTFANAMSKSEGESTPGIIPSIFPKGLFPKGA